MNFRIVIAISTLLLLLLMFISICIGAAIISPAELLGILLGKNLGNLRMIVLHLRLPRILLSVLAGFSLGISGTAFQGIFRNPLADPYIIGASSGASLGAVIAIISGITLFKAYGITAFSFVGSVLAVIIVFAIARGKGSTPPIVSLLLAGTATSAFISSFVTLLLIWHSEDMYAVFFWLLGSFSSANWFEVIGLSVFLVFGATGLYILSYSLDLLSFGDESAATSGVSVQTVRFATLILATLITAATVSFCGVIAFVGLIAPHISRLVIGPAHSKVFVLSGLIGAILLLLSDLAARTLFFPGELPVGVITSMIGAPFFLYLLFHRSRNMSE